MIASQMAHRSQMRTRNVNDGTKSIILALRHVSNTSWQVISANTGVSEHDCIRIWEHAIVHAERPLTLDSLIKGVHEPLKASLLGIPVELRLHILGYLPPDLDPVPIRADLEQRVRPHIGTLSQKRRRSREIFETPRPSMYKPLRHVQEQCWPQILIVNRQISDESASLLYCHRYLDLKLNMFCLSFLSAKYWCDWDPLEPLDDEKALDDVLERVDSLHVMLDGNVSPESFGSWANLATSSCVRDLRCRIHWLVQCLQRTKTIRRLQIDVHTQTLWHYDGRTGGGAKLDEEHMEEYVKIITRPLERLCNLESAKIRLQLGRSCLPAVCSAVHCAHNKLKI